MSTDTSCESCKFWQRRKPADSETFVSDGICRRRAPSPVVIKKSGGPCEIVWPLTRDVEFCGDYSERPLDQRT